MRTLIFQFIGIAVFFSVFAAAVTSLWSFTAAPQWFHAVHLPSVLACVLSTLVVGHRPAGKS